MVEFKLSMAAVELLAAIEAEGEAFVDDVSGEQGQRIVDKLDAEGWPRHRIDEAADELRTAGR